MEKLSQRNKNLFEKTFPDCLGILENHKKEIVVVYNINNLDSFREKLKWVYSFRYLDINTYTLKSSYIDDDETIASFVFERNYTLKRPSIGSYIAMKWDEFCLWCRNLKS